MRRSLLLAVWIVLAALAPGALSAQSGPDPTPVCTGSPPSRMILHERGRVSRNDPEPLNVRLSPGTSGERLGSLEPGAIFAVLDGPRCTERYTWYRVRARQNDDLLEGWVAEGTPNSYFVEPYPPGR